MKAKPSIMETYPLICSSIHVSHSMTFHKLKTVHYLEIKNKREIYEKEKETVLAQDISPWITFLPIELDSAKENTHFPGSLKGLIFVCNDIVVIAVKEKKKRIEMLLVLFSCTNLQASVTKATSGDLRGSMQANPAESNAIKIQ